MGTNAANDGVQSRQDRQNGPDAEQRSPAIVYAVRTPGDALHSATDRGDVAGITRILQASPTCVDARNARGRTSLHVAALIGRNDIVKLLLQYGADVNARSGWMYTPLVFAAENVHPDVIVTLVRAGAQLEARTKSGNTAMHRAVLREKNNPDVIYALAVFGADVNTKNEKGDTAIYTSIAQGNGTNALVLCAFGADLNIKSSQGDSAADLMKRKEARRTDGPQVYMLETLLACTSEDSMQKYRQHLLRFVREDRVMDLLAVLCWASAKGNETVVNFVLQVSGDRARSIVESVGTEQSWKPLHYAAAGGESGVARILLAHGAAVDPLTRKNKWTPLLLAAEKGRQRTVECLLENGADILAETQERKTAFELARDGRHPKTLRILGERSIHMDDHARRKLALERFNNAKFSLENGGGVEAIKGRPKKPRSRPPRTDIDPADSRRGSERRPMTPKIIDYLKPGTDLAHESHASRDPSPSGLSETSQSATSGSYDGALYSLPVDSSNLSQSGTFDKLIDVWNYFDYKPKHDRPVKIAILDTGFDESHTDFNHPRIVRFRNSQAQRADGEPCQRERVRAWKDFTQSTPAEAQTDKLDLDGHGTQVAGLILRLAPRSELYIARICEGNIQRGTSKIMEPSLNPFQTPQPEIAAAAIEWAIEQEVDIINLSFGFSFRLRGSLKNALKKAAREHILVFAAMSNDGNNNPYGAAWPASDSGLAIGIHSSQAKGRRSSSFTPPPVAGSHNFMVEGERVLTHWPESKGGGFRLDEGTSFATPIAVSMAALILAFESQHLCKKDREEARTLVDLDELRELNGMGRVLQKISVSDETRDYSYIYPDLLWTGFNRAFEEDRNKVRQYAWSIIQDALSR